MASKSTLRRHAAAHRLASRLEHHEKAVTLGAQLPAPTHAERSPQQHPLSRQRLTVAVTQTPQQRRRPLDVTEEQRHGPRGKLPHPPIITRHQPMKPPGSLETPVVGRIEHMARPSNYSPELRARAVRMVTELAPD